MSLNSILRNKRLIIIGTTLIILIILIVLISVFVYYSNSDVNVSNNLGAFNSESRLGVFKRYAVSTDSAQCAHIGKKILDINGTAADAIIAVLLCMGVTIPHSMGLGGGCLIVFYNSTSKQTNTIDAREEAPQLVNKDIFYNRSTSYGPISIGIPGELAGYWELHQRFGRLKWNQLFDGAIKLSRNGFYVAKHMANACKWKEDYIKSYSSLREMFINSTTNKCYFEGNKIKNEKLSQTLEQLANSGNPLQLFYNGVISESIVDDINEASKEWNTTSFITVDDFKRYEVRTDRNPVKTHFSRGNLTLHSISLPGSGNILAFIMKVMEKYEELYPNSGKSLQKSVLFYHRLIETFKYAYSYRTLLGDYKFDDVNDMIKNLTSDEFIDNIRKSIDDTKTYSINSGRYGNTIHVVEDHGTAHVSVIDRFGNAAAVSSTINSYFGSKVFSKRTGILLNDELNDFKMNPKKFNYPASERNLLSAGKRPLSSMCPSIITDSSGKVKLVLGSSGGMKITTAVATVAIRHLWLNENLKQAIDAPRIHHQLSPDEIVYENNFPNNVLKELENLGHKTKLLEGRGAVVMGLSLTDNKIYANSDYRKGGDVDGV